MCVRVYVCAACVCTGPVQVRRGHHIPGTGVTGGYEPLWLLNTNLEPLKEQQAVLTSEPSVQCHF